MLAVFPSVATLVAYGVPQEACGGDGAGRAQARRVTAPELASKEGGRGHPGQARGVRQNDEGRAAASGGQSLEAGQPRRRKVEPQRERDVRRRRGTVGPGRFRGLAGPLSHFASQRGGDLFCAAVLSARPEASRLRLGTSCPLRSLRRSKVACGSLRTPRSCPSEGVRPCGRPPSRAVASASRRPLPCGAERSTRSPSGPSVPLTHLTPRVCTARSGTTANMCPASMGKTVRDGLLGGPGTIPGQKKPHEKRLFARGGNPR